MCVLGRTASTVASHPEAVPVDGEALYEAGCDVACLRGHDTGAIGGTVTFKTDRTDVLLDMLPGCMMVPRSSPASGAVATILGLMSSETERGMIGGDIVSARLADVLLAEAIRA